MQPVSVIIITFNEQRNITRCIQSVRQLADEILVVDSCSTDQTAALAEAEGARVVQHPFEDYVSQRNFSMTLPRNDWVLVVDADEVLSPELGASIRRVLEGPDRQAYACNRLTNYCGHWIRHSGWYPDRKVRLVNRKAGIWAGERVHEYWKLLDATEAPGRLQGDLLHYSYTTISEHLRKLDAFTTMQARVMIGKGRKPGFLLLLVKPWWTFFQSYFLRLGFLDGSAGLVVCVLSACSTFIKLSKARLGGK